MEHETPYFFFHLLFGEQADAVYEDGSQTLAALGDMEVDDANGRAWANRSRPQAPRTEILMEVIADIQDYLRAAWRLVRQGLLKADRSAHNRQSYSPGEGFEQNQDADDEN